MKFADLFKAKSVSAPAPVPVAAPAPPVSAKVSAAAPVPLQPLSAPGPIYSDAAPSSKTNDAKKAYRLALLVVRTLYRPTATPPSIMDPLRTLIAQLRATYRENRNVLLMQATSSTEDFYLYGHVVNMAILALDLAEGMGLPDDVCELLMVGAFLHDLGIVPYESLINRPVALNKHDYGLLKKWPQHSAALLEKLPGLTVEDQRILSQAILQIGQPLEERVRPRNAKQTLSELIARILHLVDVYEALTHPRRWRRPLAPHEAIARLAGPSRGDFDLGLLKVLIDRLSVYPPGSLVQLTSGVIGRVVGTTPGMPTRPIVRVLLDAQGHSLRPPMTIDIARSPSVHVAHGLRVEEVKTDDRKWRLWVRAYRAWMEPDSFGED